MSSENENNGAQNRLSESELNQVAGGSLLGSIGLNGKIDKGSGTSEKPPFTTLPIDIKPSE
ncbi:hypothetical protein [Cohnella fermenti]|uniref:Uncharacterized protein n=1 Tax=Cohnella fermenti TaxID=2565925 RepID=A0A4S4BQS2_9BACL|nr:hypothetical protein [Cohnella fermenti]THF77135.1 hypothetical protein E6C55_17380 [Cohnella fermenti]